jgi:hypothetical protein
MDQRNERRTLHDVMKEPNLVQLFDESRYLLVILTSCTQVQVEHSPKFVPQHKHLYISQLGIRQFAKKNTWYKTRMNIFKEC